MTFDIIRLSSFAFEGKGGNPAGVVLCDSLPANEEMQRIAKEVNYSETVFAAPTGAGFKTRYFSPTSEVPFCGHATIALGVALGEKHGDGNFVLYLSSGDITVSSEVQHGIRSATLCSFETSQSAFPTGLKSELLDLFELDDRDLDHSIPQKILFAGSRHALIAVNSKEKLLSLRYDFERGAEIMTRLEVHMVTAVWQHTEASYHVRNFCAGVGIYEDPATGSAAAAFVGALRDFGLLQTGPVEIYQGECVGRPSRIVVRFGPEKSTPVQVRGDVIRI